VPLILNEDHSKLSKRHNTVGVDDYQKQGVLPAALLNHLVLLGWSPGDDREEFTLEELTQLFSLERVHKAPAVYNADRLRAFNHRALRRLPREELRAMLAKAMQEAGLLERDVPDAAWRWIDTFLDAYGEEIHTIAEAIPLVRSLRDEAVVVPALELERLRSREVVFYLDAVSQYVDAQAELRDLPLSHDLPEIAKEFGLKKKDAYHSVRMALTGQTGGAPLTLLFPLLGHDRIMMRIGAISSHLLHGRGLEPIKYGPDGKSFEPIRGSKPAGADMRPLTAAEDRLDKAVRHRDRGTLTQLIGDDTAFLEAAQALGLRGFEDIETAEFLAEAVSAIAPARYVATKDDTSDRFLVVAE
jgi:hypothetical protein